MTDLQKVEFDMLKEFVRICDELQLTYFLVCGSALGAVKYQGFIPWDDDLDVALPRSDYEVFCEKAQSMLPEHLFLQNYRTDPMFPMIFSKIRNSNTTYIEKSLSTSDINHGVYIDVFPLDGYPEDAEASADLERKKYIYNLLRLCCLNTKRTWKTALLVFGEKLCGYHRKPARFVQKLDSEIRKYKIDKSKLWCNHGNWQGMLEYAPQWHYGKGTIAVFEGLSVRIPEKFDEYLTQKYGEWRKDPPKDEQVGHHYYEICDLNNPYTNYVT